MLPLGLLLLRESLHADLLVLAAEQAVEHPPLVLDAVSQGQVLALIHRLLGRDDGDLRVPRDSLRRLQRALHERLVARESPRREPPLRGVRAAEGLAGEDQLHGAGLAEGAREALAAAGAGDDAEPDLGLAEVGHLGAVEDVGHHGELAAAAEGVAGDGGDDGLLDLRRQLRPRLDEARRVRLGEGQRRHLLDVGAGRERLLRPRQHDHRDAVRRVELAHGLVELGDERRAEGVEGFGPVESY